MLFNRLNINMVAHQNFDTVCYVHKKFGVIREKINATILKKQDGVTNQPKRFKFEALKSKTSDTNGPGKKAIIVGTKTKNIIKNLFSPSLTSRQSKVKQIEPLKRPCRPVPLTLQQQQLRGPSIVGKYLDDISALPPKPLQPMVEPCIKRIDPLKAPFRPVPLPLQQQLRGPPMLGNYLNDISAMLPEPLNGPFRPVPLPLQQPLKGYFIPLPLQQEIKEPLRSEILQYHQQQIFLLRKQLEDIKKMYDHDVRSIYDRCKLITDSKRNMTIPHLTNTTLRSANKENLIKKPKEKYVESDSKEANAKKTLNKRKYIKKTTPRLSPGVLKAKIESLSPTTAKEKQKKLQQAVLTSNSKQASGKKPPNKRKYNKRTIETPSQQNLEQAVQAPTLNSLWL